MKRLLARIRKCRICEDHLEPRPVVAASPSARIVIIGQAPGRKVHASGVPWDDVSGRRLRAWLGIADADFYDPTKVALVPMGFCFPGMGKSGDLPPRPECAPEWHPPLLAKMPDLALTLLLGQYAQARYLPDPGTVTQNVERWADDLKQGRLALPHPSPRSRWTRQNPWFEAEVLPKVQALVKDLLA